MFQSTTAEPETAEASAPAEKAVGSEAGVQVPAHPKLSGPSYVQGFAPEVGFFDCGKDIVRFGATQCVPAQGGRESASGRMALRP